MQKPVNRRQAVKSLVGGAFVAGSLTACEKKSSAQLADRDVTQRIRSEYANNETVLCHGYVLSKSEAALWRERGLC